MDGCREGAVAVAYQDTHRAMIIGAASSSVGHRQVGDSVAVKPAAATENGLDPASKLSGVIKPGWAEGLCRASGTRAAGAILTGDNRENGGVIFSALSVSSCTRVSNHIAYVSFARSRSAIE
jgi:hypothetical protein